MANFIKNYKIQRHKIRSKYDPNYEPRLVNYDGHISKLLSTSEYSWQIPLGNHEKRPEKEGPETGQEAKSGPIATGLLVSYQNRSDQEIHKLNPPQLSDLS